MSCLSGNNARLFLLAVIAMMWLALSCHQQLVVDAAAGALEIVSESKSEVEDLLPSDDPIPPEPHREEHNIRVRHESDKRWEESTAHHPQHPTQGMSPHEEMRCIVCRSVLVPTLVRVISQKAGTVDHKELVFGELEKLAGKHVYDMVSKSTVLREVPSEKDTPESELDSNIHHYIQSLLWDDHMAPQLIAFADVWEQQPRRRHWFRRLIDHSICPCHDGKVVHRLDDGIEKYFMNHVAATIEASKRYEVGFHEKYKHTDRKAASLQIPGKMDFVSEEDKKKLATATQIGRNIWVDGDHGAPDQQGRMELNAASMKFQGDEGGPGSDF